MTKPELLEYKDKLVRLTYKVNGYTNINYGKIMFVGRWSTFFDRDEEFEGLIKNRNIEKAELVEESLPLQINQ